MKRAIDRSMRLSETIPAPVLSFSQNRTAPLTLEAPDTEGQGRHYLLKAALNGGLRPEPPRVGSHEPS